ncbi:MAG: YajQ family cyclic di-GMP-binding protein [Bacillota bacterium]
MASFDVVSEVDMQEVDNAINQTMKEIRQRFDFKGSKADISLEGEEIKIVADDDFKLRSVVDILETKAIRRNVPLKSLAYGKIEPASGGTVRQLVKIQRGISKEKGKEIIAAIKQQKLRVQAQMMDDQVRVTGKKRDDLQATIQLLKDKDFDLELQFTNYRD